MAQVVATQTYNALATADSPLATKAENARIDHRQSIQETQLATIIDLLTNQSHEKSSVQAHQDNTTSSSPPRSTKRTKPTLTPVKKNLCTDVFSTQTSDEERPGTDYHMSTQSYDDDSVPSATSNLFEEMEGCDE